MRNIPSYAKRKRYSVENNKYLRGNVFLVSQNELSVLGLPEATHAKYIVIIGEDKENFIAAYINSQKHEGSNVLLQSHSKDIISPHFTLRHDSYVNIVPYVVYKEFFDWFCNRKYIYHLGRLSKEKNYEVLCEFRRTYNKKYGNYFKSYTNQTKK